MTIRKFSTVPRRVASYCWTLVALAILAAPGLAWGQDCSDFGNVFRDNPGPYILGSPVRLTYEFGAETITPPLTLDVNDREVRVALDCISALSSDDRENCLGFHAPGVDPADFDVGDSM